MPKHTDNHVFQTEEFEEAITDLLAVSPVVTSRRVADRVRCSRERARQFLLSQFQNGVLERQQVGGGAIIYYPPKLEQDAVYSPKGSIVPAQSRGVDEEQSLKERALFFPNQREIAVDRPQEDTRSILSQAGHLVDSTEQSYLYKISEADVWNAPYEEFNDGENHMDEIADLIEELADPVTPYVDSYEGKRLVMHMELELEQELLVHLHTLGREVSADKLSKWIPEGNPHRVKSKLGNMKQSRKVHYENGIAKITPIGVDEAEEIIDEYFESGIPELSRRADQ